MEEPVQEQSSSSTPTVDIYAAGGLIYRNASGGSIPEILLIHRPDRDWSFPKGKQDPGETLLQTAIREVKEETGLICLAEDLVGRVNYLINTQQLNKEVSYWSMTVESGEFKPNSEVDKIQWATIEEAKKILTWDRDRDFLTAFMNWYEKRSEKSLSEIETSTTVANTDSAVQEKANLDSDLEKIESNIAIIESAMNRVADGDLDAAEDLISDLTN